MIYFFINVFQESSAAIKKTFLIVSKVLGNSKSDSCLSLIFKCRQKPSTESIIYYRYDIFICHIFYIVYHISNIIYYIETMYHISLSAKGYLWPYHLYFFAALPNLITYSLPLTNSLLQRNKLQKKCRSYHLAESIQRRLLFSSLPPERTISSSPTLFPSPILTSLPFLLILLMPIEGLLCLIMQVPLCLRRLVLRLIEKPFIPSFCQLLISTLQWQSFKYLLLYFIWLNKASKTSHFCLGHVKIQLNQKRALSLK